MVTGVQTCALPIFIIRINDTIPPPAPTLPFRLSLGLLMNSVDLKEVSAMTDEPPELAPAGTEDAEGDNDHLDLRALFSLAAQHVSR